MHNKITTSLITNTINTPHRSHTYREGLVETSEEEVEEDILVEEKVKSHDINLENKVTMPEIT